MGDRVRVFEVGLRDGLQNEPKILPLSDKLEFARELIACGIRDLELGAFVRSDRVPQMADSDRLFASIRAKKLNLGRVRTWSLVPNRVGLVRAFASGARNLAVFTAATESFAKKNIGMSIQESLLEFQKVRAMANHEFGPSRWKLRGYVSTAFGCPFEGKVSASKALKVIAHLAQLPVDEISIGDTIGVADPRAVQELLQPAIREFGADRIAVHFHDTRGTALANCLRALDLGVRTVDSSFGGLGGCPFAPGAAGNLATEDLVYMLDGMRMKTGINLDRLAKLSVRMSKKMNRPLTSRYVQAWYKSICR